MGPIAARWAETMSARGHQVEVITAHPHYPGPLWGRHARPYRETRNGIPVLRLPLMIGHRTTAARILEEATYAASAAVAAARASTPDVAVAVSPSFLGLFPVLASARARRFPWVLWLEDILPDAAATTGLMREGPALRTAQRLERYVYQLRRPHRGDLERVPREPARQGCAAVEGHPHLQPLHAGAGPGARPNTTAPSPPGSSTWGTWATPRTSPRWCARSSSSPALGEDARLILAGTGELALEAAAEIRSMRVEMPGLLLDELEEEMQRATIGLVPQRPDVDEFNLPSKLMNLMSRGVPVLASVNPTSEIARIVHESGAGWVVDAADPDAFPRTIQRHPPRPGRARPAGHRRVGVRPPKLQPGGSRHAVRGGPLRRDIICGQTGT